MATTTANRHGLRAAATERRNKHAQRTPLPPRAGQVEAAKEAIATASLQRDTKSWGKADAFAAEATKVGSWAVTISEVETGGLVQLVAKRGTSEFLHQAWLAGVWQYESSTYTFADRTLKPRNASGAKKLLARSPEDAEQEMAKVASNKHFRKREPEDGEIKRYQLPFDPDLATDEEIISALKGQRVEWYNRLTRSAESDVVSQGKFIHITVTSDNKRVVNVCSVSSGFRSFYVDAILKVGRGKGVRAIKTDAGTKQILNEVL